MTDDHFSAASGYFDLLADRFPVMCASDEFHFLPRAVAAARYYDRVDNLAPDAIEDCIHELKSFRRRFRQLAACETDLEKQIDLMLLAANVAGVLIEFEANRSWRCNPLFYLKIAFIGLDHAFTKPAADRPERNDRIVRRLNSIPRLLHQGLENLQEIPDSYHVAAQAMLPDCRAYLADAAERLSALPGRWVRRGLEETRQALKAFEDFLSTHPPAADNHRVPSSLTATLGEHFLSSRSPQDVFQIAEQQWHENLAALKRLQQEIDPRSSWRQLYHDYAPAAAAQLDTLSLYRRESDRLRGHFGRNGFSETLLDSPMTLKETPPYLLSVRSSASFAAAFSDDPREISYFYITTRPPTDPDGQSAERLRLRFHREYKFLTAHETFPGHQLLDTVRRSLANPVRRQIESPLFYEGWATYAETLLGDSGYAALPIERLVDHKRRLWRAARCQIDVGLQAGYLTYEDALNLLDTNGFSRAEAVRQIDRFRLNPGYQLCYSLGCHEFRLLVAEFRPKLPLSDIHEQLLSGGQLPFHLIRRRIEAALSDRKAGSATGGRPENDGAAT